MWRKVLISLMSSAVPVSPCDAGFSQARLRIHWTLSGRYHWAVRGSLHFNLRGSSRASGRQFPFGQREDGSLTLVLIHTLLEECGLKEKKGGHNVHLAMWLRFFGNIHTQKSELFSDLRFDSLLVDDNSSALPASTDGAASLTPFGRNRRKTRPSARTAAQM